MLTACHRLEDGAAHDNSPYAREDATHLHWAHCKSIGCELIIADFNACGDEPMLSGGWMQLHRTVQLEVVIPVTWLQYENRGCTV